jgi:hypothetical protein
MGMGSGGIKGPESARARFRCGVYQTSGLGRGRCTLRRDGLLCDGLGDVATTQPRSVVARLANNGREYERRRVFECCERVGDVGEAASGETAVGLCKDGE